MELNLQDYVQDIIKKKITTYHVVVRQHDKVVGRFDWRDNRRDNVHSVSKSFLSMAIGMAIEEGVLRLDEKPADIFADKLPKNPSENLRNMTIEDMIKWLQGMTILSCRGIPEIQSIRAEMSFMMKIGCNTR